MIFGDFASADAEDVRLAHTLKLPNLMLKKGRVLSAADIAALQANGIERLTGARLAPDDVDEDAAAKTIAALLENTGITARPPYTGRCNLYARTPGVLLVDQERVDRLNQISETVTLATLPQHAGVRRNQRVATVKIIPFAIAPDCIAAWRQAATASPLRLAPLAACRAALIMGVSASTSERLLDLTVAATRLRLESMGSGLALTLRCAHEKTAMTGALRQALAAGCDLLLVMGATISKDRADVVPAAIVAAGGEIEHFGLPVEPGNMLLVARIGRTPVFNLPGCARSANHNGIDIVLQRLLAGLLPSARGMMNLGVGGLIARQEDEETAEPEPPPAPPPRIAALVLAAGRSSRMGEQNKLLCPVDGAPLVLRAVNAALASRAAQVMVVTGHEAERIEAALAGQPVSFTYNPDYPGGMASSLRCGLRALCADTAAVIVLLADMPAIGAADIDRLIDAFDPAKPAVLVPEYDGRRGNPVLWPRRHFAELASLSGDIGGRGLLEQYAAEVQSLAFPSPVIFVDVDTPEALAELSAT
ncbi:MAG: molybdopterin-binding/glycosyltransferase family 2 protein [Azonexus sp.]|jgi:molybdenum cofactor cytidylyltransferase|nr:molybdopterin-binding/glycosyltransferase family 2 protein [Azonexus sp.]